MKYVVAEIVVDKIILSECGVLARYSVKSDRHNLIHFDGKLCVQQFPMR